jgi:Reverse transcriptase (RNA-dependent DNA polymerase)
MLASIVSREPLFGLVNAPALFQRAMDIILAGIRWDFALVYMDDIISWFSEKFTDHRLHLYVVLTLIRRANASLKLSKCEFAKHEVNYLGHVIRPGILEMQQAKVDSLRQAKPSWNKTELRSFLGLANADRRFVPSFAKIAKPLTDLTKHDNPESFQLSSEELSAFMTLKEKLTHAPV